MFVQFIEKLYAPCVFAAFFPWKTANRMVKYACKVTSSRCLSQSFTAVHEDIPKCMPEERLLLEPVKLDIRGFESRRALQNVSPVDWFCPSGRKKERYTKSCARTFLIWHSLSFGKARVLRYISQSNAKASLAWEWIPCYPKQCQKISFRTVQEALNFSAAAFAWVMTKRLYYL